VPAESAKQRLNIVLTRLTGHHLVKGAPGAERQQLLARARMARNERDAMSRRLIRVRGNLRATRKELAAARREAKKATNALARIQAKRKEVVFPGDFDDDIRDIIRAVMPFTMTDLNKLHALIMAVRYIVRYKVPGDIVECGVWRGGSMHAVARTLTAAGDQSRDLYLYDTFEGMPPPTEDDVRWDGNRAADMLENKDRDSLVWAVASLEDVQDGFQGVPYPADRIHYVQGKVEDTVPEQLPQQISILRLDTDWYESTAHELKHMYERLAPGGVLMLDDYGHWAGAKKATDEFIERTGEPLLLLRMSNGRVAVKPWR
jgi:O-methyltransferase